MLDKRTAELAISLLIYNSWWRGTERERLYTLHLVNQIKNTTQANKRKCYIVIKTLLFNIKHFSFFKENR